MSNKIIDYLIWVTEIVARNFFNGDKGKAYLALKETGLWDVYSKTYDTTHCLGSQYILEEIGSVFTSKGVTTC